MTRPLFAELIAQIDEIADYDEIEATITALAGSGDRTLVPELTSALHGYLDAGDFYGRDIVAQVLIGLQGAAALPELLRASARDLGDDQDSLSTEVVELLKADPAAARATIHTLITEPAMRSTCLWALGFVAGPQDTGLLLGVVTDPDPAIRSTALGALPSGDERTVAALIAALRDPEPQVRVTAVSQLGYLGGGEAVPHLAAAAGDPSEQVRRFVPFALGRTGHPDAVPPLLTLLAAPSPDHGDVIAALGRIGGPAALDALRDLARDPDPGVRADAAPALLAAGAADPATRPLIVALAADPAPQVRAAVVGGLVGTTGFAELLPALADDTDGDVRRRVAAFATRIAPDLAAPILRRYLADPLLRPIAERELTRLTE